MNPTSATRDHERGAGRRRAPRVAGRVLARELPTIPAIFASGAPMSQRDRAREERRRARTRRRTSTQRAEADEGDAVVDAAEEADEAARRARARGSPRRSPRRTARVDRPFERDVAHRRDRRDARRLPRGDDRRQDRDDRCRRSGRRSPRSVAATTPLPGGRSRARSSTALRPIASAMPATTPTTDASTPTTTDSPITEPSTCAAARADRAQQRHLARALRDDDRERVVDDERCRR